MDLQTEVMKKLLIDAAWQWLEANKNAIGDKWYEKISKHLRRADTEITDKIRLMGYALWLFNIVTNFSVVAYISRRRYTVWHINENLDQRTTKQLIAAIHMCLW
ncbi:MAG: hypothetical protein QXX12_03070 [Nanopusillaceae archaeon]